MARVLTTKDAYALMNALVRQATGQTDITVTNTSDFVSVGEKVLATGTENVLNSLSLVLGRTIVASRPYKARLDLMEETNNGVYSNRVRKISYYAKDSVPSGYFNTDLYTNFADGFTAGENPDSDGDAQSTKSMWEQHATMPLEMNFGGSSTWQYPVTIYENKLEQAFRSPEDFNKFVEGYLTEHANDIESQREAWNRMNLLNKIGSVYDMGTVMDGSVINLTKAYNDYYNTEYTSEQLRTTYLESFLKFFVATFKTVSGYLADRGKKYHWAVTKTVNGVDYNILRHTPKDKQRVYLYEPLFDMAKANVLPEIFNPEMLDLKTQYQPVTYWQSPSNRPAVKVTPAVVNTTTGVQEAGTTVDIPYVVGLITDVDGLMTNFMLEVTRSTPVEARKGYRTIWHTFLRNNINDNTENAVLFVMEDEEESAEQ